MSRRSQPSRATRTLQRLVACCAGVLWASCVAEGDESWSTVDLALMASSSPSAQSVVLPIDKVDIHVSELNAPEVFAASNPIIDGDDNWHSIAVGRDIELVGHQAIADALDLGSVRVPPGKITQFRIVLLAGKPATVKTAKGSCTVDVSGIGKAGIKVTEPYRAFDTMQRVTHRGLLQLDLAKAFVPSGSCYKLIAALGVTQWTTDGKTVTVN